ncbi:MAG TPA: hypothetical protein PK431_01500 [Chitinophagales bacterium]|nr:hypothetical protein [Chitinophagales bacterium]
MQNPFRNIDGKLYITKKAMIELGVSDDYIRTAKSKHIKGWFFIDTKTDKSLIGYEDLKDGYKTLITNKYGDVYDYITLTPLRDLIKRDIKALKFFESHVLPTGKKLPLNPVNYVEIYTRHAEFFNMITHVQGNKSVLKKELNLTMDKFWETLITIIKTGNYQYLPQTTDNIKKRWRVYNDKGYESLISSKFGNSNTTKLTSDEHVSVLLKLISMHQNLEDTIIAKKFNQAAAELGWNFTISASTVAVYRKKKDLIIASAKYGKGEYTNRLRVTMDRDKPKHAGVLFEYDGWTVELLFQDTYEVTVGKDTGKLKTTYTARHELLYVYDPYNDYVVGYHIGKENTNNVISAVKNAVDNIHRLTGKYFLFNEFVTDNFGNGSLTEFYNKVAVMHRYTAKGMHKNPKDKTIEPNNNRMNNEVFRTQPNSSGHNLTSRKENQPNMDILDANKKYLPTLEQGIMQIEQCIAEYRSPREAAWLNSFYELIELGRVHEISREMYLQIFGEVKPKTNKLTGRGIVIQINNRKYVYNLLDIGFRELTFTNWNIVFDRDNMRDILLINEDGSQRYLVPQKESIPLALSERTPEHDHIANQINGFNSKMKKHITENMESINTAMSLIDQTTLKTMFIDNKGQQKNSLQNAKNVREIAAKKEEITIEDIGVDTENVVEYAWMNKEKWKKGAITNRFK